MNESTMAQSEVRPLRHQEQGLLTGWVMISGEFTEKVFATAFDLARDVQSEVGRRVLSGLDFVGSIQQGSLGLARSTYTRLDTLAHDSIDAAESIVLTTVRTVSGTSRAATELAGRMSQAFVSKPEAAKNTSKAA